MPKPVTDLTGRVFGNLKVLERCERPFKSTSTSAFWLCQCLCGNRIQVSGDNLKSKNTTSCGCKVRADSGTGVQGVFWDKRRKRYFARITVQKTPFHLGSYSTIDETLIARNLAKEAIKKGKLPDNVNPKLAKRIERILETFSEPS